MRFRNALVVFFTAANAAAGIDNPAPAHEERTMHRETARLRAAAALLLSVCLASTRPAAADTHCVESDTPRQCVRRLLAEREATAQAAVTTANTGISTTSSPARSALKDFLSVLSAHFDQATLKENGQSLALTYNLPANLLGTRRQVQVETVFTTPQLSGAVAAAAGTTGPALVSTLSSADDVQTSLTFNPLSRRFGQSIAPHQELFESMLLTLLAPAGGGLGGIEQTNFDIPFAAIVADAAARPAAVSAFEEAARGAVPAVADKLTTDFATLLGNQPQLYVSGDVHWRKPIVGPHGWQAIVTWEIGSQNLNGFYASDGMNCDAEHACVQAFERYMKRTTDAHDTGRLALSIAYNKTLENTPPIANPFTTPFFTAQTGGIVYSAAYSHPFASLISGREGRIDLTLTYDGTRISRSVVNNSGMALHLAALDQKTSLQSVPPPRDRFVAAGTYTQKLSDRISVPLSLVWSDHSESFPGSCTTQIISPSRCTSPFSTVERKLVVHVGVIYKIPPRAPVPSSGCCCPSR